MSGIMSMLLGAVSSAAAAVDEFFNRVTLLLPGNGTNGAQNNTFLDSSSNNFTITRNGNTTQGTFSPFSQTGWSNFFDGSGDNLTSTHPALNATFTIEAWIYRTSGAALQSIVHLNNGGVSGVVVYLDTSNYLVCTDGVNGQAAFSNLTVPINAWTHIAVVRSGGTTTGYVNGTVAGSHSFTPATVSAANIGAYNGSLYFPGYISNVRVVNGSAVYTGAFTPPTSPLTAITNTSLLTCQSNRFMDNSSNAYTITRTGDVSVQAFSPFLPTVAYSAATVGGSGYFDGTTDYLTLPYSSQLQFTGNFTIEFWAYPLTQVNSFSGVFNNYSSWPSSTGVAIFCGHSSASSTKWCVALFGTFPAITSTNDYVRNAWSHIALVRNGTGSNNITLYVNGVASGTTTSNNTVTGTADNWWISTTGDGASTQTFTGYLSGFRATNSAEYTANFTPPTAPLTAGSNKLLLNFTNAGITDATAKNVFETAGNAQISTTQSKFGGSSMYFDGSGDYLVSPNIYVGDFLTGDFTIEYWFRCGTQGTSYVTQVGTLDSGSGANSWRFGTHLNTTAGVYFSYHNGSGFVDVTFTTTNYNDNAWHHAALTRSGSTVRAFIDGTQVGSNQTISTSFSARRVVVGAELSTPTYYTGYIDDLRITKGYARYTSNFTAPTSAFALQ